METLKPYQEEGAKWLTTKPYALLADEMRLGKSAQSIHAADTLTAAPILVLCPAIARTNWSREFAKFSSRTLSIAVLLSGRDLSKIPGADVVICSYDLIQNTAIKSTLRQMRFDLLILDEAHFLKSPDAKRTQLILGKGGIVHSAKRVWLLTGTPAPNNAAELWPMLRVFDRTKLSYDSFITRYCSGFNGPYGFQITGTKNVEELRALLAPIMLRRTRKEVLPQLLEPQYSDIVLEPGKLDIADLETAFPTYIAAGYDRFQKDVQADLDGLTASLASHGSTDETLQLLYSRVEHVASLRRYVGMLKAPPVVELVRDEFENGGPNKIVLFAQHKAVIEKLRDGLADYGAVTLYGGTPDGKRNQRIASFQNNPKCRVFIGNIQACGTAIDLSAANDVLFVEPDWVPMNNAQAAARVDNIAKTAPLFIRFVGLAGSIDEHIARTLRRKTADLARIFSVPNGGNSD